MNSLSLTSLLAVAPQRPPKSWKRNNNSFCTRQNHGFSLSSKMKNNATILCCRGASEEAVRGCGDSSMKLKNTQEVVASDVTSSFNFTDNGIGILKFLSGKNFFITGGTGFVGKAVIEKIARGVPDVGKIFVLIKGKDKEVATNRLQKEIIDSELFESLKQMHGKSYQDFMSSKLIPVVGNVCESELGMDAISVDAIAREIDIIINVAANTTFDESFDIAINTNTRGPCRLINFAKKCKQLSLFLHVSTAYVNGKRKGIIMEKPFNVDIDAERNTIESTPTSCPALDIDAEIKLAMDTGLAFQGKAIKKMKELGLERARIYGWRNTYEFTKSMGEMQLNKMKGEVPLVIVRPSVILSTSKEPFPGWIQGNRMLDPLMLSYGKGFLPGFLLNPEVVMDFIPIDMVVNTIIAAITKHGIASKPGLTIYHATSSVVNPLLLHDLFKYTFQHFAISPIIGTKGKAIKIKPMEFFSSMEDFSSYIWKETIRQNGLSDKTISDYELSLRNEKKCKKVVEYALSMAKTYEPYMFFQGRFDNGNTIKLMKGISKEEMKDFGFDVKSMDWKDFITNVHIPGLRKHVMMRRGMPN